MSRPAEPSTSQASWDGGRDPEEARKAYRSTHTTLQWLGVAVGIGLAAVVLVPLLAGIQGLPGIQLIVAAAATAVGFFLGFLFGIPKTVQPSELPGSGQAALAYRFNTNLEQISDWLTKILVGVGLTQLTAVGPALRSISEITVRGIEAPTASALVGGGLLYFLIVGFLIGYLWTRLVYPRLLVSADTDAHSTVTRYISSLEKKIEDSAESVAAVAEHGVGGDKASMPTEEATVAMAMAGDEYDLPPVRHPDDPARGRFGGRPESNGRRLSARVVPYPGREDWFRVAVAVAATEDGPELTGNVRFYVHHTFKNPVFDVPVENGVARAVLVAWGAFTVGAVADGGKTKLELNLAELSAAPPRFREN